MTTPGHPPARNLRRGFTLLEVLIAAVLLVVALVGSIALTLAMSKMNRMASQRDTAYFLAQQALEQVGLIPLGLPAIATTYPPTSQPQAQAADLPLGGNSQPTTLTCYPEGNDISIDRPIPCTAPSLPSAFFLRTWICCGSLAAAGANSLAASTSPLTGQPCVANLPAGIFAYNAAPTTPDNQNLGSAGGTVCFVQAEVTWPTEDPTSAAGGLSAAPANLFADNSASLPYSNHVFLAQVRMQ